MFIGAQVTWILGGGWPLYLTITFLGLHHTTCKSLTLKLIRNCT
jgi:hypothetical protein